jgi:ketosteroid isomerase-like protein
MSTDEGAIRGVAYAYGIEHMTGTKQDGADVDLWFRATACLRRRQGHWRIAHVDNSVPLIRGGRGRRLLDLKP